MVIERRDLGTPEVPDIGNSVEIFQEPDRSEMIRNAAQILVTEQDILVDEEMNAMDEVIQTDFNANLVDFLDSSELSGLAGDVLSSIQADIESRSEWEKTYTDGLKYLGMKFDETRSGGSNSVSSAGIQGASPSEGASKD